MTVLDLLDAWDSHTENLIKINIGKHEEYSDFVKEQSTQKHFWFAMLWLFAIQAEYLLENKGRAANMEGFFVYADKKIKQHPDCFKEKTNMLAHELLWRFGSQSFYESVFNINTILSELDRFIK